MRRSALAFAVVNNVVAFARAIAIVVAGTMQGILHYLSETLRSSSWQSKPDGTLKHRELDRLNMFRGILGLPKLVPACVKSPRRSSNSCRRSVS